MQIMIHPSRLSGAIYAPASKSSMQRACAAALLSKGDTVINNPGQSNDDLAAIEVIRVLGARVEHSQNGSLHIFSQGVKPISEMLNCGESGLGLRMFAPIAALSEKRIVLDGHGSLLNRPMDFFDEVFPLLGIEINSNSGKLPITIKGPLIPKSIEIDGSLSSQFLTGLLFAYAAAGAENVTINVRGLQSKPYIDLTLQVMECFGWKVENKNYQSFYFPLRNDQTTSLYSKNRNVQSYTVEGDWSGGAFLLVAGAISGQIVVKGLDNSSAQADRAVLQALIDSGAAISLQTEQIIVGPASLKAFRFDAVDCPDLFPPLVALAAFCEGTSVIKGVHRLAHKESDRARALQEEFAKMGVLIKIEDDQMLIFGGHGVIGAVVHSRHDHRIAMACAVAGLAAQGVTTIQESQAVRKSYPGFYDDIKFLQAVPERNY
jgi:3-phosphoshikimate 1-carboxyvinyltransferase